MKRRTLVTAFLAWLGIASRRLTGQYVPPSSGGSTPASGPAYVLLGSALGLNFNSTSDQAITISPGNGYIVRRVTAKNASAGLSQAQGGIYTAASKGGDRIVDAAFSWASLGVTPQYLDATIGTEAKIKMETAGTVYLTLDTAESKSAHSVDMFIWGDRFQ